MGRKKEPFKPLCVYDAMGFVRQTWIAAEKRGEVVELLLSDTTRMELYTREIMIGQIGPVGGGTRYIISEFEPEVMAQQYKHRALTFGATPEAVRLLGLLTPLTAKEESDMGEKLTAKKTGNKEALKDAAAKTPVAAKPKADKPAKKGNPEALAKAREAGAASRAAQRERKIKALKKPKDIVARDGSFRKKMLEDVLRAKTVGEFYDLGTANNVKYDSGCLKFAIDNGYVTVG